MKADPMTLTRSAIGLGVAFLLAHGAPANAQGPAPQEKVAEAKPGDVRVMSTAAVRTPLEAVRAEAQKAIGHPIVIQFGSARGNIRSEILAGQAFEIAIVVPDVAEELVKQGKAARGFYDLARVDPSIAQRGDAPHVDVSTPAALKTAMLNAKALRWGATGTSLPTINKILDTLGIREAAQAKFETGPTRPLAKGEYLLDIRSLSELLEDKTLRVLGPVPSELLIPTVITAVISANPGDAAAARALVKFLQGPGMEGALKDSGMRR